MEPDKKPLKDRASGELCFILDPMGDDRRFERRESFIIRDDGRDCRYPHHVPTRLLGCIQGDPNPVRDPEHPDPHWDRPRVVLLWEDPCRDPGESDGRIMTWSIDASVWAEKFDLTGRAAGRPHGMPLVRVRSENADAPPKADA